MSRLLWLDLETTGLTDGDYPLEIAVVVTEGFPPWEEVFHWERVLHLPDWMALPEVVFAMHEQSGLLAQIETADPLKVAARIAATDVQIMTALDPFLGVEDNNWCLAGTGTDRYDRGVLARHFTLLTSRLAYKGLDISPIREALRIVGRPDLAYRPDGDIPHRALADTRRAIAEWAHYARLLVTIGCPDCGAHRDDECRDGCPGDRSVIV